MALDTHKVIEHALIYLKTNYPLPKHRKIKLEFYQQPSLSTKTLSYGQCIQYSDKSIILQIATNDTLYQVLNTLFHEYRHAMQYCNRVKTLCIRSQDARLESDAWCFALRDVPVFLKEHKISLTTARRAKVVLQDKPITYTR